MKGRSDEQEAMRRAALYRTGLDPDATRTFVEQTGSLGMDGPLMRLPATMAPQVNLFDPVTGDYFFMIDMDEIDGDSPIQ
jgi:hypothetical protein